MIIEFRTSQLVEVWNYKLHSYYDKTHNTYQVVGVCTSTHELDNSQDFVLYGNEEDTLVGRAILEATYRSNCSSFAIA